MEILYYHALASTNIKSRRRIFQTNLLKKALEYYMLRTYKTFFMFLKKDSDFESHAASHAVNQELIVS